MNEAKIADIFLSYQGEGPYVGTKQLFIRFYGCSFDCAYCDTKPASYETFTKEGLLGKISEYKENYHSISITGGEPLEQAGFLREFLPLSKKVLGKLVYLETNGILYEEFKKIIDFVDIVAMDIKLPSSTKRKPLWHEHKRFLEIASSREVFVKVIVTGQTDAQDVLRARDMVRDINKEIPFILQPVDPVGEISEPSQETLIRFKKEFERDLENVKIVPQWHKAFGVK